MHKWSSGLYAFQTSLVMHAVASESARVLAVGTVEVRESSTRNAEIITNYSRAQTDLQRIWLQRAAVLKTKKKS